MVKFIIDYTDFKSATVLKTGEIRLIASSETLKGDEIVIKVDKVY
jgi:hypothetical protein